MSKATEELLDLLHGELAKEFLRRIKDGTATAADLSAVRQFLKDNGIDAIPKQGSPMGDLIQNLPFQATEDTVYN